MVPNIKNADGMNFAQFVQAFDDIVARARTNKLQVADFQGTTISLTNPGHRRHLGSVPRLMPGQGAIIATGAMDFPAEFAGTDRRNAGMLGIRKVMTVTCTYDHRIIQGAESGSFLAKLQQLLMGEDGFYEEVFRDLKIPYLPVRWQTDQADQPAALRRGERRRRQRSGGHSADQRLSRARASDREHESAGRRAGYHPELDPASYGLTIWDLDRQFLAGAVKAPSGAIASYMQPYETLREILERLRQTYCGTIGVEYMHIQDPEQKHGCRTAWKPP